MVLAEFARYTKCTNPNIVIDELDQVKVEHLQFSGHGVTGEKAQTVYAEILARKKEYPGITSILEMGCKPLNNTDPYTFIIVEW